MSNKNGLSGTVTNYCGIGPELVEFISDTTPIKQDKFSPGAHIPVRPYREFEANHPDYGEVVGSLNPTTGQFQYSEHLTQALTKNPAMGQLLQSQTNPLQAMQLAYQLANSEKPAAAKTPATPTAKDLAQNALNTATAQTAAMPGSAVGGSGEINSDAAVEKMSTDEFAALDAKVMSGQLG